MDGMKRAIEELGGIIAEQQIELDKRQELIDSLQRRIDLITGYIEVYEECLKRRED